MYCTGQPTNRPVTVRPRPPTGCRYRDNNSNCPAWKSMGYCTHSYQTYMRKSCQESCFCGTNTNCRDLERHCPAWRQRGYCRRNSRYYPYMAKNCKKSCGSCQPAKCATQELYHEQEKVKPVWGKV
ncbi:putative tyrosinase-like protein tyr-3 [Stylophora pistillata]|uniref:putative tyrosinase-like protein tyr-3 n=1 Tax=Stylophora pistillata TaxID=50429 RepID=UPI000C05708E|nr:putative tyrosinase-like protein tyr-3 [Stylophora pistillata]